MPADHDHEQPQRRCPVCWTTFTVSPRTPNKRYCCPACRVEDWRRRADPLRTQTPATSTTRTRRDTP